MSRCRLSLLVLLGILPGLSPLAAAPLRVHPQNPYIFEFRGKPTLLRTFAGSYSSLIDAGLPYIPYLEVLKRDGMNLTRVWCLGFPPDNAASPADFLQPWPRATTGGKALDGYGKWDFSKWNEEYFTRLKAFTQAASDRGIVVEYTLFSVFYGDEEWKSGPFHPSNNVQGYGPGNWHDSIRPVDANLLAAQKAAVRRMVRELNGFDNVYFEIINEPFWNEPNVRDSQDVAFHQEILAAIRDEEATLPNRHLVAHNFPQQSAALAAGFDIINEHYPAAAPATPIGGAEALLQNQYSRGKILALDETDTTTATQVRLEAWMFLIGGGAVYDGLDASAAVYRPSDASGDNALGRSIRQQVRNIGIYMEAFDLITLRRDRSWVTGGVPAGATLQASATAGGQYVAYLHHGKSGQKDFQLNYDPIDSGNHSVRLGVTLPAGNWRAVWTRPSDLTEISSQQFNHPGGALTLAAVTYQEDVALRILPAPGAPETPAAPTGLRVVQ